MGRKVFFAVLFSLFVPGLGQIYNEDLTKGFIFMVAAILGLLFFGPGYVVLWLWSVADAYVRAYSKSRRPKEA